MCGWGGNRQLDREEEDCRTAPAPRCILPWNVPRTGPIIPGAGLTTTESQIQQVANLPIPFIPSFTVDELVLIIGTCCHDPVFLMEVQSGLLAAANPRFLDLLERNPEDLHAGDVPFESLVVPEDRALFNTWNCGAGLQAGEAFEIRLRTGPGGQKAVEIVLAPLRWARREYLLGFIRLVEDRRSIEIHLRQEVEEQKKRTLEAVKSSVRVYQITEKIRTTLALTKSLLNTESDTELFGSASRILTGEGLNYRDVTFLLRNGNSLDVRHSTTPQSGCSFSLLEDNRYSRFIRRNFSGGEDSKDSILVPLKSRGSFLGLIDVGLFQGERIFFDDLRIVSEWQLNVLFTIGDIIALHLDNLRLNTELRLQSITDPLTGSFNRNHFNQLLPAEIRRCAHEGVPISMLFIDVDHLKPINDAHGHLQGDLVLRELGEVLRGNLRDGDFVCRYGGDEFTVLLPGVDTARACRIAEKLQAAVKVHRFEVLEALGTTLEVTISIGVSSLGKDLDEHEFLKAADAALYRAKNLGRNRTEAPADTGAP